MYIICISIQIEDKWLELYLSLSHNGPDYMIEETPKFHESLILKYILAQYISPLLADVIIPRPQYCFQPVPKWISSLGFPQHLHSIKVASRYSPFHIFEILVAFLASYFLLEAESTRRMTTCLLKRSSNSNGSSSSSSTTSGSLLLLQSSDWEVEDIRISRLPFSSPYCGMYSREKCKSIGTRDILLVHSIPTFSNLRPRQGFALLKIKRNLSLYLTANV